MSTPALRVALYSLDAPTFPCARLRILDPAAALAGAVDLRSGVALRDNSIALDLDLLDWCEVVVLQRGFPGRNAHQAGVIDRMRRSGKPIVYETDDDFASIPDWHGKEEHRENAEWIRRLLPDVALVTVSTDVLRARFAKDHPRVEVLPNCVNEALWPVHAPVETGLRDPHLLYAGNRGHWQDLATLEQVLRDALERHPELTVTVAGVDQTALAGHPRVRMLPFNGNYHLYPARLAALAISFAVVPLRDHPFNDAISPVKFLEFAALGIPGIFQDMAPYRIVEDERTGLKAARDAAGWSRAIDRLVEDDALRQRLAENANRVAREEHLLSGHAHRWLDAWRSVLR